MKVITMFAEVFSQLSLMESIFAISGMMIASFLIVAFAINLLLLATSIVCKKEKSDNSKDEAMTIKDFLIDMLEN